MRDHAPVNFQTLGCTIGEARTDKVAHCLVSTVGDPYRRELACTM